MSQPDAAGGRLGTAVSSSGDRGKDSDLFERLLMPPTGVIRQLEADGCGPACLEMALALEHGAGGSSPGLDQASLAAHCRAAASADDGPHPLRWASSPAALQHVLNAQASGGTRPGRRPQHYHVVHAAGPHGPLDEVIAWVRGPHTAAGPLALPSFLLTRHGTHWMLVVGARVGEKGLVWLAAADPWAGCLLGLTPAGVQALFTPNLVGTHPDWTGRHVAVIPSVLPRRAPTATAATAVLSASATAAGSPTAHRPSHHRAGVELVDGMPAGAHAAPVLAALARIADEARDPRAIRWLAPLREARHLIDPGDPVESPRPAAADSPRRAWVVDAGGRPVAELALQGAPATLLHFAVIASGTTGAAD